MRYFGIIEMGGGVVQMFHLFCPRLYAGFQSDKTKGASNQDPICQHIYRQYKEVVYVAVTRIKGNANNLSLATTG